MPLYDTTNLTSANNIYEYTVAVNQVTENMFGMGIVLTVFFIALIYTMREYETVSALSAASLAALLTATILLPLSLITWDIYKFILLLTGAMVFIKILTKQG